MAHLKCLIIGVENAHFEKYPESKCKIALKLKLTQIKVLARRVNV